MRISWFVVLGLFSLLLGGAGCSASVTVDTCSASSSVVCNPGEDGFSCTGSATPAAADGTCSAGPSAGDYCCSSGGATIVITTGCSMDSSVAGCASPSTGYSCTGTVPPDEMDPTLSCSIGVVDPTVAADLVYCCLTGEDFKAGTCGQDDTITSICTTPGSYGFKCAAMDSPDQTDASLTCSSGVPDSDGSSTDFCCTAGGGSTSTIVITAGCSVDPTVTGC